MLLRGYQKLSLLKDTLTQGKDFWGTRTITTVVSDPLTSGSYRATFISDRPLQAALHVRFEGDENPPLIMPLDPDGDHQYSRVFRISAMSREVQLLTAPPVTSKSVGYLTIDPLTILQLTRLGWQRLRRKMKTPRVLLQKLWQVASGAASFSLTPETSIQLDESAVYAAWRNAFEGPAERARLLAALKCCPGQGADGILAVYGTATGAPKALQQFLTQTFDTQAHCRLSLLILEHAGAPLARRLRDKALRAGATIIAQPGTCLPLQVITAHALEKDAEAFIFIERHGHFDDLAFASFLLMLRQDNACSAVYADHDILDENGERREPWFKPEWSPDYALALNYAGPAIAFRARSSCYPENLELVGHATPSYELLLRMGETRARASIQRIPRVLFHEAHSEQDLTARLRRLRSETAAIEVFLRDQGDGSRLERTETDVPPIVRRVTYSLSACPPLVSVIVPTKDNPILLRDATYSVLKASYPAKELIVVDNGSCGAGHNALMQELTAKHRIKHIHDPRPFNFSALINVGRKAASGSVIVLFNDDIKAIDDDWLQELVCLAKRPRIGCVGALLLYADDAVQHAGMVLGIHGSVGHAFRHVPIGTFHPYELLRHRREVSAVTGACLAVRSKVFDELGGLDETLPVTLNDVDFCLRAREKGYRTIFTPHARLYHFESQTRGLDVTPERLARLSAETAKFMRKWGIEMLEDPYYSPHLSKSHEDFRMRLL